MCYHNQMLLVRISLLLWLLAAPSVGAAVRYEQVDAEWGLAPATRPSEMERGCRVESASVKALSQQQARMSGGPGLASSVSPQAAPAAGDASSSSWTDVLPDGRDTHLRLAILLI